MGTLIQIWKTISMPVGATTEQDGTVTWVSRGKKKTGKLSGTNRVSVQSDTWTAQFSDETGKVRRVSTKTTNRSVAEKILAHHETAVDHKKLQITSCKELDRLQAQQIPLEDLFVQFQHKMMVTGYSTTYIKLALQQILSMFKECKIDSVVEIRRETIERWIVDETQRKMRSIGTINTYLSAAKAFTQYLTDSGVLLNNPLKRTRKLDGELDRRKIRRAMTPDEVKSFLQATALGEYHQYVGTPRERVLIYRLLLGTGLWSTEISLLTPNQIDFANGCLTLKAAKIQKNKAAIKLPIRADLLEALRERIETRLIEPHTRIFRHNNQQILKAFYKDLKAAGIERVGTDGRSIDISSLRETFGTMLAMAGVPLLTAQRLMRHSTLMQTARLYIDVEPFMNMVRALELLPVYAPLFPADDNA